MFYTRNACAPVVHFVGGIRDMSWSVTTLQCCPVVHNLMARDQWSAHTSTHTNLNCVYKVVKFGIYYNTFWSAIKNPAFTPLTARRSKFLWLVRNVQGRRN